MKPIFSSTERGQALIIIALAAIGLFGMVGLAIDGTTKYSDRRHAQNAADAAVLAGGLALVNGQTAQIGGVPVWKLDALNRALDNGYDDNHVTNEVEVYLCTEDGSSCGPYADNPAYLQVIITSHINTTFARVIGISQMTNTVQAVTYFVEKGPLYDGNLIVALKPDPCTGNGANGNIALGTSGGSGSEAEITLTGGGAFVNSGGTGCGLEVMGCPSITINNGEVSSTGNGNINTDVGSAACQDKITVPEPNYRQDPYPFPPEMPDAPDICATSQPVSPVNNSTLAPGHYSSFPPSHGNYRNLEDDIVLQPGIYCLDTDLSLTNGHSITGNDVLIYIRDGNTFSIEGGTLTLRGRDAGDYEGYVVIVDSDFSGQSPNCTINGNASTTFTGTIFAPYCDIEIDGGGKTTSLSAQIIGYTVKVTGSQAVNLTYDEDDSAENTPKIGFMR